MTETPFVRHNPTRPCFGTISNLPPPELPYAKLAAMPTFTNELAEQIYIGRMTKRAYKVWSTDKAETMWEVHQWAKEQRGNVLAEHATKGAKA